MNDKTTVRYFRIEKTKMWSSFSSQTDKNGRDSKYLFISANGKEQYVDIYLKPRIILAK